ncbi:hypothetical protein ETD86_46825 [Nonomuraea turkmeniaca]|uniref:Uncharacterized protein n=1 Tax=Nonomuraea turkmeniaca TaxID=103838 RepID=A0A5S4EYI8_9ACTN|nr:hypothetical protein [Nonomuraea turkmeniaca]TMR08653.1 hypothetical protein ETD86_46825 [Nonomuraea turkmeniaca]
MHIREGQPRRADIPARAARGHRIVPPIRALALVDVAGTPTLISAGDEGLQAVTFPGSFPG